MWIVIISMVSGALMYTLLVANAAAMMTNVDITAKAYKSKVLHRKPLNWTGKKGDFFASVCNRPKKTTPKLSDSGVEVCSWSTHRCICLQMNHLDDYMTFMKLPKDLRARISSYYQARYAGKWFDEKDILNWVSSSLKEVWCGLTFH